MNEKPDAFAFWHTFFDKKQRTWRWTSHYVITIFFIISRTVPCNTVSISGFEKQTLNPGSNFTLQCKATGLYHVTITWLLDGLPLEYEKAKFTESIQLKAENPHLSPGGLFDDHSSRESKESRYSIKTSNDPIDDVNKPDDATYDDVIKNDTHNISNVNTSTTTNTPNAGNETKSTENVPSPNGLYSESVQIVLPSISLSEDGLVSVKSELTLVKASVEDGGIYTCVAHDIFKKSARWSRKIAVLGPLSVRQNRPIFALVDSVVIIPCTVLGSAESFAVTWSYQKFPSTKIDESNKDALALIQLPNDHRQTVHDNGSLEIRDARKINEGTYTCQTNLAGKITNMSTPLKVMVPPKIKTFTLKPIPVGKPLAEFCVVSEGDIPLDIFWYRDGVRLRPNAQIELHRSGKRALSLTINGVSLDSAGNYSCCAQNNVSRTCKVSRLVVLDPPKILDFTPKISAVAGNDVVIPCHVTGFPKPNVTWMRVLDDSTKVPVSLTEIKNTDLHKNKRIKMHQNINGSLVSANVSSKQGGKYMCRAKNEVDELSRFVTLVVYNPARIVYFRGTQDVVYGSDVVINCAAKGDDLITIRWFKDGAPLRHSDSHHELKRDELKIQNSSRSDTGVYACEAVNKHGSSIRSIDVIVKSPPPIPAKFEIIDKGTSFLQMIVTPADDDGGSKLLSYVLTFTKIFEEISPEPPQEGEIMRAVPDAQLKSETVTIRFPASAIVEDQKITLDKLQCGTEYKMHIRSENEIGESFKQLELTASTIGSAPMIPTVNELVVDVNQTAMVLDLRAWQNGGCPITKLEIEYARHGDREWNVSAINSIILKEVLSSSYSEDGDTGGKNPGHVIISNLQVGTWYKVWTSACNSAGCNRITHSVATLSSDGATVPPLNNDIDKTSAVESDDARFLVPMVCGFGLVLLLVLLFWLYRYKQRSKKQHRMKEARKMANTLLYKTEDNDYYVAPPSGINVITSEQDDERSDPNQNSDNESSLIVTIDPIDSSVNVSQSSEQNMQLLDNPGSSGDEPPTTSTHVQSSNESNSTSDRSKKYDAKKSLKDNEELAVFRDPETSDDDVLSSYPLVCDESAFGDSGTWAYYQPGSKARRPRKYKAVPMTENRHPTVPRRCSSSSSSTDEELAQVFGLTSSKKFKPVNDNTRSVKSRNSDINDNYRSSSKEEYPKGHHDSKKPIGIQQPPKSSIRRNDHFFSVRDSQDRSHSAGMVQQREPQFDKVLPQDLSSQNNRRQNVPVQNRQVPNTNPFKTAFRPPAHPPINLHRPIVHTRGHTYTHDNHGAGCHNNAPYNNIRYDTNVSNSSPYGERQWVDTYDSNYGTARSKRPSWGSTELDKESFCTPPSSNLSDAKSDLQRNHPPKYRGLSNTPERQLDRTYPNIKDPNRKLDSNSPRDSGIGSDETSNPRHLTSSISPPKIQGRNVQKSLESLDEVESHKGNRSSSSCSSTNSRKNTDKNFVFSMSPPPTPPSETKLTPHIFVDISSKCNTTPTRRPSRSSYPPCTQQVSPTNYYKVAPPIKLGEYFPTPPPSAGPTSPEEQRYSRSRTHRKNDGWGVANLDGLGKYHNKSDSQLAENDKNTKRKTKDSRGFDGAIYHVNDTETSWQTSTLV